MTVQLHKTSGFSCEVLVAEVSVIGSDILTEASSYFLRRTSCYSVTGVYKFILAIYPRTSLSMVNLHHIQICTNFAVHTSSLNYKPFVIVY
jgi:hypothetical protein